MPEDRLTNPKVDKNGISHTMHLYLASPIPTLLDLWLEQATDQELDCKYTFTALFPILRLYFEEAVTDKTVDVEWWWRNSASLAIHILAIRPKLEEIYGVQFTEKYNRHARKMIWQMKFQRQPAV